MAAAVLRISETSLRLAAEALRRGGVIGFPTDTVYGLGCDPRNGKAVKKLLEIKGRTTKPVSVLCDSIKSASHLVDVSPLARKIARTYWPGALTLVLPLKVSLPKRLHQGSGWLGVRVPAREDCLKLIEMAGGWITGTSANRSGLPPCRTAGEVRDMLGDDLDIILDGGSSTGGESTVARIDGEHIEVLREGPIRLESGASQSVKHT